MSDPIRTGRIIATYGKESLFEANDNNDQFLITANRKAGKAVCGDIVTVTEDNRIASILPRQSEYIRPDFRHRAKVLAANVDTVIWLTSHTPPNDELIAARALIVSRLLGLELIIIQSKADSLPAEVPQHLSDAQSLASICGIPWFKISTVTAEGISELTDHIASKKALIVGQSGVGKSTLVHHLTGDESIRTQSVSEVTGHGRHTTTTAKLYQAESLKLELIDAPGMRDIGLWQMPESDLLEGLPEIEQVAQHCRFNNCQHNHEPDCAVKTALENGEIPQLLYRAYCDAKEKELLS